MTRPACLVCLMSTVGGCRKNSLEEKVLVVGHRYLRKDGLINGSYCLPCLSDEYC